MNSNESQRGTCLFFLPNPVHNTCSLPENWTWQKVTQVSIELHKVVVCWKILNHQQEILNFKSYFLNFQLCQNVLEFSTFPAYSNFQFIHKDDWNTRTTATNTTITINDQMTQTWIEDCSKTLSQHAHMTCICDGYQLFVQLLKRLKSTSHHLFLP